MAVKWADNVEETTASTGTGTVNLDGATSGNQTFVAGLGTGNACFYCIASNSEYEAGYGTVTDATPDASVMLADFRTAPRGEAAGPPRRAACSSLPPRGSAADTAL